MRIACLRIARLPLIAALRADPSLCALPVAVVQTTLEGELNSRCRVLAATDLAIGVHAGQTLAEAQAVCVALRVLPSSAEKMRGAAWAAFDAASSVSPRVEEIAPGLLLLDIEGLDALFGPEAGVARALLLAAERVGLCAAVGLAEGRLAAQLAAHAAEPELALRASRHGVSGGAARVIAKGEQPAFLGSITIALVIEQASVLLPSLDPRQGASLLRTCIRFGVRTLGELVRLPVGPLSDRLGPEGVLLHRLARGEDRTPLLPAALPERFTEGEELEWEVSALEPLLFIWKSLLDRLCTRLDVRGLAARTVRLCMRLADGGWDERAIDLAAPTRETAPILQLLKLEVEARPPQLGVSAVRVEVLPSAAEREQLTLFGPRLPSTAQLSAAVARIAALVGPDRVGEASSPDRHEAFPATTTKFTPPKAAADAALEAALQPTNTKVVSLRPQPLSAVLSLSLRALRPPRAIEVRCDAAGHPRLIIGEGLSGGAVVSCAGPWRIDAEWWTDAQVALDEYDVELAGGLVLRVAHVPRTGVWLLEAVYD